MSEYLRRRGMENQPGGPLLPLPCDHAVLARRSSEIAPRRIGWKY